MTLENAVYFVWGMLAGGIINLLVVLAGVHHARNSSKGPKGS